MSVFLFVLFLDMDFDVVWALFVLLLTIHQLKVKGLSSRRCMNIIDCVDFLLQPLLPDTHFVLRRPYGD